MEEKTKGGINIPGVNERKNKEKGLTFLVRMEGKTKKIKNISGGPGYDSVGQGTMTRLPKRFRVCKVSNRALNFKNNHEEVKRRLIRKSAFGNHFTMKETA